MRTKLPHGRIQTTEEAVALASGEREKKPCPRCGEPQGNVPLHLRTCDGGEGDE